MLPHPCYLKIAPKSNRRKQPKQTTSKSNCQKPTSQLLIFLSNLRQLPSDPLQSVIDGFWRFPKDYGNLLVIVAIKVESYHSVTFSLSITMSSGFISSEGWSVSASVSRELFSMSELSGE